MVPVLLLCHLALVVSNAPHILWNISVWPSQKMQLAANGSTVAYTNGSFIEGRDAETGAFKYSLSGMNNTFLSDALILFQQGETLYGYEVESGAYRFGNPFYVAVEYVAVLDHMFLMWTNNILWGCTLDIGAVRWKIYVADVTGLTVCGARRVCVQRVSTSGMFVVDTHNGKTIWGPITDYEFTTPRAYLNLSDNVGILAVAAGGYLSMSQVLLLNIQDGSVLWNVSLGPATSVTDLLINEDIVAVTYITLDERSNNAYPSSGVALTYDGKPLFRYGPKGYTMGDSRFLSNGDIVFIGEQSIKGVSGKTGATVCELLDDVQDYNVRSAPAVLGTRFYATYFQRQSGYTKQQLVGLQC